MQRRRAFVLGCAGLLLAIAAAATSSSGAPSPKAEIARQIRFGADMARQGNWHEAIFRWQRALAADPQNPRLHNNLAVAYEFTGAYDKAQAEYRAALTLGGAPDEVYRNQDLFEKFYKRYKEAVPAASEAPAEAPPPAEAAPEAPKPQEPDAKAP